MAVQAECEQRCARVIRESFLCPHQHRSRDRRHQLSLQRISEGHVQGTGSVLTHWEESKVGPGNYSHWNCQIDKRRMPLYLHQRVGEMLALSLRQNVR